MPSGDLGACGSLWMCVELCVSRTVCWWALVVVTRVSVSVSVSVSIGGGERLRVALGPNPLLT